MLLLVHYLRPGPLPYGIGWWGFTFPLGAYTVATLTLARAWSLSGLDWAGAALFVLLGLLRLAVAGRTIWTVHTGEAWRAARSRPPIKTQKLGEPMSGQAPSIQRILLRMRVSTERCRPRRRRRRDELARTWGICPRGTNDGQQVPYGRGAAWAARAML